MINPPLHFSALQSCRQLTTALLQPGPQHEDDPSVCRMLHEPICWDDKWYPGAQCCWPCQRRFRMGGMMGLPHRSMVWTHSRYRAEDPVPPINVCLSSPWITRAHCTPSGQSTALTTNSRENAQCSWEQEKCCKVLGQYETSNSNNYLAVPLGIITWKWITFTIKQN